MADTLDIKKRTCDCKLCTHHRQVVEIIASRDVDKLIATVMI